MFLDVVRRRRETRCPPVPAVSRRPSPARAWPSRLAVTPSAQATPLRYVALGDSYSAASGVLPPDPAAPLQCLRSIRNYPHVIAARPAPSSPT